MKSVFWRLIFSHCLFTCDRFSIVNNIKMYKRRTKSSTNRTQLMFEGADIVRPNNTSLLVNQSRKSTEDVTNIEQLAKKFRCELSDDEDEITSPQNTDFAMLDMARRLQSTPKSMSGSVLKDRNDVSSRSQIKSNNKSKSQGTNLVEKENLLYFEKILKDAGATKLPGDGSYTLSVDQAIFTNKVSKELKAQTTNLDMFMESLEEDIKDKENLKKLLTFTQTAENCAAARGPIQEPIMRLLLNIDCLQFELMNFIIEKIADIVIDSNDDGDFNLVPGILRQMRFLNRIKDDMICDKLFELIAAAPLSVQREIIYLLPEITTEKEQMNVATELVNLLKDKNELTPVIIDALSNLSLDQQLKLQVQNKMMTRLNKCPVEYLPVIINFILTRTQTDDLTKIVNDLREELPFTLNHFELMQTEKDKEKGKKQKSTENEESCVKLTFDHLKFSVMTCKHMTDCWIKIVNNILTADELRPVDVVMMIIIYNVVSGRKTQILTLLRNKIKCGILQKQHFDEIFKILYIITEEYNSSILELAANWLKYHEQVISEFGSVVYQICFTKYRSFLRQSVINELLLHIGTGTPYTVTSSLTTLLSLCEQHLDVMSSYAHSAMGLLLKIADLDLNQVRQLINLICSLIHTKTGEYGDEMRGLKDELHILIRKQISSCKTDVQKKGVVGSVVMAKHIVTNGDDVQDAKMLLECAMGTRNNNTTFARRGFFYDELATMIKDNEVNEEFVQFWNQKIRCEVFNNIFVKDVDVETYHFPLSLQFSLDIEDDREMVLPVVKFYLNQARTDTIQHEAATISSALRLLWCTEKKCNTNLTNILPMLTASVILPDLKTFDKFNTLDYEQQKIMMDCLFLSCNYFIECINAFCTQKSGDKILLRLKHLTTVRKYISQYMGRIPDYFPPLCQFYAPVVKPVIKKKLDKKVGEKKSKKSRKRKSDGTQADSSDISNQSGMDVNDIPPTLPSTAAAVSVVPCNNKDTDVVDLNLYRTCFRELQCHTFKVLRYDLKLSPTTVYKKTKLSDNLIPDCYTYKQSEKLEMGPSDFLFILEDFVYKTDNILKEVKRVPFSKVKTTGCELDHMTASEFVTGCIKILPKLCVKLETLSEYCKDLLETNEGMLDALGMFPKDSADIKLCMDYILKVLADILSWKRFQAQTNRQLLKDVLTSITSRKTPSKNIPAVSRLVTDVSDYLHKFNNSVLLITTAVSLIKCLQACRNMLDVSLQHRLRSKIAEVCLDFMQRPWFTLTGARDKGAVYNQYVDILLKNYFTNVDNQLDVIHRNAQTALDETTGISGKEDAMETYKCLTRASFPLLYRVLCESLVTSASNKLNSEKDDHELCLDTWSTVVHTLLILVDIVKTSESRINLSALLKRSQSILQLFLSKGIPVMESALRIKSTEVLKVLKSLQGVTRFLHSVCCHSKITSDAVMASHVPTIRAQCERLTLEVKGMLILNKIPLDYITIAVLKNRDIQGNDILSQETNASVTDDETEIPPEEEPSEDVNPSYDEPTSPALSSDES